MSVEMQQRLEKIANMVALDVPKTQIARAVGLSEGRITQILESEEFKEKLQVIESEELEKQQSLNDGWDTIEQLALQSILTTLQYNKDPDFALRAATMANRANRRGAKNNQPLQPQTGARVVLNLTQSFVSKLEGGEEKVNATIEVSADELDKKGEDAVSPKRVEELLAPEERKEQEYELTSKKLELALGM